MSTSADLLELEVPYAVDTNIRLKLKVNSQLEVVAP